MHSVGSDEHTRTHGRTNLHCFAESVSGYNLNKNEIVIYKLEQDMELDCRRQKIGKCVNGERKINCLDTRKNIYIFKSVAIIV